MSLFGEECEGFWQQKCQPGVSPLWVGPSQFWGVQPCPPPHPGSVLPMIQGPPDGFWWGPPSKWGCVLPTPTCPGWGTQGAPTPPGPVLLGGTRTLMSTRGGGARGGHVQLGGHRGALVRGCVLVQGRVFAAGWILVHGQVHVPRAPPPSAPPQAAAVEVAVEGKWLWGVTEATRGGSAGRGGQWRKWWGGNEVGGARRPGGHKSGGGTKGLGGHKGGHKMGEKHGDWGG